MQYWLRVNNFRTELDTKLIAARLEWVRLFEKNFRLDQKIMTCDLVNNFRLTVPTTFIFGGQVRTDLAAQVNTRSVSKVQKMKFGLIIVNRQAHVTFITYGWVMEHQLQ